MSDVVEALYQEIDKAKGKGLIPMGGSSKLANKLIRRADHLKNNVLRRDSDNPNKPAKWNLRALKKWERVRGAAGYASSRRVGSNEMRRTGKYK